MHTLETALLTYVAVVAVLTALLLLLMAAQRLRRRGDGRPGRQATAHRGRRGAPRR